MKHMAFLFAFLLAASSLLLVPGAQAQDDPHVEAVLDVMPDMSDRFESVDDFIREQKWDRTLEKLAEIAEEAGDTVWTADGKTYISVREFIRRLIITLPPEGLAYYRATNDPEAKALYNDGLAKQDVAALDDVERKYPASAYAEAALDAAASLLIDRANYSGAAARLGRLASRPPTKSDTKADLRLRVTALGKLAFCQAKLGQMNSARAALDRLQKAGGGDVRIAGGSRDLIAFVRAELERGPAAVLTVLAAPWCSPCGSPSHALPMTDVRLNLSKRWEVKIGDESASPGKGAAQYGYNPYGAGFGAGTTVSPLPVADAEGVVYVNTGKGVYAVDHISGRLRWTAKPGAAPAVTNPQPGVFPMFYENRWILAQWRSWQGGATVSVGQDKVFAVEVLGENMQGCFALSAFDSSSGKRIWSFQQKPDGGDFESVGYFPWAPACVDGQLVGLAAYRDQTFICALEPSTGKIRWKTFISADQLRATNFYGQRGLRSNFGLPVVVEEGIAYVVPCSGAVAAVDLREGQLLWVTRYSRSAIDVIRQPQQFGYTRYQPKGGWTGGFPVVAGGRLYIAPSDSNSLLVLDTATGSIVQEFPRGNYTHFAGVRDGAVVLVGPDTAAVDTQTGNVRWLVPTPFQPEGMPVLAEHALLIPAQGKLCTVRLDGEVTRVLSPVAGANTKIPLGNVVSVEGRLITANRAYVTGYFSFEETYAYLSKLIEQDTTNAKPLVDRGDLCFLHGKYTDALRDFQTAETALAAKPVDDPAIPSRMVRMIFETRLRLAETDTGSALAHVDAARKYIYNDVARARFQFARGSALTVAKQYQDAVDEYITIIEKMPDLRLEENESSIAVSVLAQSRIGELVSRYGDGVYERLDAKLKPRFDELVRARDAAGLQLLQVQHPHSSLADNCLFESARFVEGDKFGSLRAQTLLRSLTLRYPRSEILGPAYSRLLDNCIKNNQLRLAAVVLKDIREKNPDLLIPWEGKDLKGAVLSAQLLERKDLTIATAALGRYLPTLLTPLKQTWQSGSEAEILTACVSDESPMDRGVAIAANMAMGAPPFQYYGSVNKLRAFDPATGQTLWTAPVNAEWCFNDLEQSNSPWSKNRYRALVACSGGVVAFCHPLGINALDLANGKALWERKWTRPSRQNPMMWFDWNQLQIDNRLRQVMNPRPAFTADAGRIIAHLPDGNIYCIDAATGKDLWHAKHEGYATGPIGIFNDLVVVCTVAPNNVYAYSAFTGKLVYSKPMPGQIPGAPAFDRTRNRIILNDGVNLYCHSVTDFRQLWKSAPKGGNAVMYGIPWSVQVLPDNQVMLTRYTQIGNSAGYGVVMYDSEDGKELWSSTIGKFQNDANGFVQSQMIWDALVGKDVVFIPSQTQTNKRVNNVFQYKIELSIYVIDRRTGKQLRECTIEPEGTGPNRYMQFMGASVTSDHAILAARQYGGTAMAGKLYVVSGETGKLALEEKLPNEMFTGQWQNLFFQRFEAVPTADGGMLVPTGKGLTFYGPAGAAKPPEEKKP